MSLITISRGSYSDAKLVAEELGKRLGYPVLTREQLLESAGRQFGISDEELRESFVNPPGIWQRARGRRLCHVKCVTATLLEHAVGGKLVYHGYVGHLLLAGLPQVLRLRVVATMEDRIAHVIRRLGMNRKEAVAHIRSVDSERARWAIRFVGENWDDNAQYHAILNLSLLGLDCVCAMVGNLLESPEFKATEEASGQATADTVLACRVWAALVRNPQTRDADLSVQASNGSVVISGNVGLGKAAAAAEEIALTVDGVTQARCEAGMGQDWYW